MSEPVGFRKITLTLDVASTRKKLSETPIFTQQFEVHIPSTATGPVYIGDSGVDNTWIPRAAGSTAAFTSSSGGDIVKGPYFDLSKIYALSATAGDTVIIQYTKREP